MGTKKWAGLQTVSKELEWNTNRDSKLKGAIVINMLQLTLLAQSMGTLAQCLKYPQRLYY